MKLFGRLHSSKNLVDRILTSAMFRWTWSGLSDVEYLGILREYRPADAETVREMMDGRYLLASKLVDTGRVSPFAPHVQHESSFHQLWHDELHGFSWLRHFSEAREAGHREFARTLVLDWIGRYAEFDDATWGLTLTVRRVMNWLRHLTLLEQGASREQTKSIFRAISTQVQATKLRTPYATDCVDALMAAMLPVAVSLCDSSPESRIRELTRNLCHQLECHLDEDGFFLSRDPATQLMLLEELVSLRLTLSQKSMELVRKLGEIVDRMHLALDCVTLSTGEPVYFNGCGQLPTELIFTVQTQGTLRREENVAISGYGVISEGDSVAVLDVGRVPPAAYARNAHAGALAVEFTHGRDLVFGSCGPAPQELQKSADVFRVTSAHSAPTIDDESSGRITAGGVLVSHGEKPVLDISNHSPEIVAQSGAYRSRFGVEIERQISFLSGGETLVGQDRIIVPGGRRRFAGTFMQRFHLAPGAIAERSATEEMITIRLKSGAVWTFLWESASAKIAQSARQSAHIGYHRTQQIVLESELGRDVEVAWIFTLQ